MRFKARSTLLAVTLGLTVLLYKSGLLVFSPSRSKIQVMEYVNHVDLSVGNLNIYKDLATGSLVMSLYKDTALKERALDIRTSAVVNAVKKASIYKRADVVEIKCEDVVLTIALTTSSRSKFQCYSVVQLSLVDGWFPMDTLTSEGCWYGGSEAPEQHWPLPKVEKTPFVANDMGHDINGPVMERYWLSPAGTAVFVDPRTPLHMGHFRSGIGRPTWTLELQASYADSPYRTEGLDLQLNYTICQGNDIKAIHTALLGKFWLPPEGIPSAETFTKTSWSTGVRYKSSISQNDVTAYAQEIAWFGLPLSEIELDYFTPSVDVWKWDPNRFSNISGMVAKLSNTSLSARVGIKISRTSKLYTEARKMGYLLKVPDNKITPSDVGFIDFTNSSATDWFVDKLSPIKQARAALKFDVLLQDLPSKFESGTRLENPMDYCTHFAQNMRHHTDVLEVRCAYRMQHLGPVVRMTDRRSVWDYEGGLRSIIPTVLLFGLIGYPFVHSDVIGGQSFSQEGTIVSGRLPDNELYIRWLQLAAFLPIMHFSIAPWDYDDATIAICRTFVKLHTEYVAPKVIRLAKEAKVTGYPIIRPLWWIAPMDPLTYGVDSQFLIGDEVMVAPVLEQNAKTRSIYFPEGRWKDMNNKVSTVIIGPLNVPTYQASLSEIPYFEKLLT